MPVSLHTHSWYSLLEGASSPETLLARAVECGYSSLALTDTNNLYGAVKFTALAHRHGLRPLLGACLRDFPPAGEKGSRCVALIAEPAGYRNLCRILSRLHLAAENAPRLADLLRDHADGLHLLVDDAILAERLREAYGPRLWLEIIRPGRSGRHEKELLAAARRLGLRPIASTAVHFATPADYPTFRLATAVRQGGLLEQLPARLSITPEHHLLTPAALTDRFRDLPEAVYNTDRLAEQLRTDVLPHETILPPARVPRSLEKTRFLRLLCERGLEQRELHENMAARQRLAEELTIVEARGLESYFLVVRDIARHARRQGFSMALRGSAGNSLICYLLHITNVNPLRFQLPLERFLHPGRPDLPDIDLDFDWKVRDAVIAHVFERYGMSHTAMICTHLFLQPRSAFREAGKIHGLSNDQISRVIETTGDWEPAGSEQAADGSGQKDFYLPTANCPLPPGLLGDARRLLGRPHHLSVHPGGIVITPGPIEEFTPLQRAPKGVIITQYEKDAVEHIGLVKIDLLGNRALATVDEAQLLVHRAATVRERECEKVASPLPDGRGSVNQATLALIQQGDTLGVNQLESPAMRHLLVQLKARGVEDVIVALALVRPGAASGGGKEHYLLRRHGKETYELHPRLEPVLRETEGIILYEDDAARVLQALSGWSVPEAHRFYKRLIKHEGEAELKILAEEFFKACAAQGIPRDIAVAHFVQATKFQYYAFCKSHAVSYGLIAWQACYLKTHYPLAFWTAALNNNQGMYPRRVYVEALKRSGIPLCLPCVNRSQGPFAACGLAENAPPTRIRVGLEAIATLSEEIRQRILTERERGGPYLDVRDLLRRAAPGPETLAALIRCGALDFTGLPRPALFLEAELSTRACGEVEERSLFPPAENGGAADAWMPADYAIDRRLKDEWDLLGFIVGPPLMSLFRGKMPANLVRSRDVPAHVGRRIRVAGVVATYRNARTQNDRDMQFVTLEDEWGLTEVTLFPGTCPLLPHWHLGPYIAVGVVEENLGVCTVNATEVFLANSPACV